MKKLSVYLYSIKEAEPQDATLVRLYDCGNSGERYEQVLKIIDNGDPKAIGEYYDKVLSAEEFDVEFESFLEGPISPKGYKTDVNVRDEAQDKDIHTSTWTHADNAELLLENLDDLRFAEDFPELLKQQIQDTIAKGKKMGLPSVNHGMPLHYRLSKCATFFPLSLYRSEHPEVTDDNIYVGVVRHLEMNNVVFEIQLDDKEKFDKKKMSLFTFTILESRIHPITSYHTGHAVPMLLYGNTLYYGGLGDWQYEGELYGLFRFKKTDSDFYDYEYAIAGDVGSNLKECKDSFVDPFKVKDGVVVIPDGTEQIGITLKGNTSLKRVVIPDSVTEIGTSAFEGRTGLTSIDIPNSVKKIGWSAFRECTGLKSIVIGNSVTEIGYNAFQRCTGLKSITIPGSVTEIEGSAFMGCTGLTSIVIQEANSAMTIDERAFLECQGLKEVTVLSPVKKLVLKDNNALETLTLGTGINKLEINAASLKTINVPDKKADYYKKRLPEELHGLIVELPEEEKAKKK